MEVDAGAAKSPWGGQWKSIRRPIRVFGALEVDAGPLRVLGAVQGEVDAVADKSLWGCAREVDAGATKSP